MAFGMALSAQANEEAQAKQACERVIEQMMENIKQAGESHVEVGQMCQHNSRSLKYWQCIDSRMQQDQRFGFAAGQCEKVDPQ
jgi:ABC-type tungstate transport system permease subunit